MYKGMLALLVLAAFSSCGGPGSSPLGSPVGITEPGGRIEELVHQVSETGGERLLVKPNIDSPEALESYRQIKINEAAEILEATKEASKEAPYYPVVITMNRPIPLSELNSLIRNYNPTTAKEVTILLEKKVKALPKTELVEGRDMLFIEQVKFVSTTGNGKLSYETLSDAAQVAGLEAKLAAKELRYNGVANYELVRGVTSVRGGIHRDSLMRLENEPQVFLADIGPKEFYDRSVATALWNDVYEYVEKYSNR